MADDIVLTESKVIGQAGKVEEGAVAGAVNRSNSLSEPQTANLKRFEKNLPGEYQPVKIFDLPGGGKAFQSDVPASNILGSFAQYEKQVDVTGKTVEYTKTTYAPDGSIVHVKDKIRGTVLKPGE